jgi:hypothetical protein
METYDRPYNTAPLSQQTPGLDPTQRVKNIAMRPVSWARERPDLAAAIIGGIAVVSIGAFFAIRASRKSRFDELMCYVEDMYGKVRSRF